MRSHYQVADGQLQGVSPRGRRHFASRLGINVPQQVRGNGLRPGPDVKGLPADLLLIMAYVFLTRSFIGNEAALGIKIGPVPLFVTDATLIVLIAMTIHRRGGRLLNWIFGGGGAGAIGRAVWLLFLMSTVYCALAFPKYGIMALHDLAIFGYSIFFPLTYFAIKKRRQAVNLVQCFIYATCAGAVLFNFQALSGINLFSVQAGMKGLGLHQGVKYLTAGVLSAALGPALAGLLAYVALCRKHRVLHAGAILLCGVTLVQVMDRSSFLGFGLAAGFMFVLGIGRSRIYLSVLAAGFLALVLISAQGELPVPGGIKLHNFWLGISSGADVSNDPDAQFRMQRWGKTVAVWLTSPVFGVGFGAPIMLDSNGESLREETKGAIQRGGLGAFNVGMPHNSFLMAMARMGLIGLGLICFAWLSAIVRIVKLMMRGVVDADLSASVVILIAMIPIAALNLFFEQPMLCAPFWIILAVAYKLSENAPQQPVNSRAAIAPHRSALRAAQPLTYQHPNEVSDEAVAGWQARWQ